MARISFSRTRLGIALLTLSLIISSCQSSAKNRYYGKTEAPTDNVMRYISGSEPESLDPQVANGQPEARLYMAIYDGLVEYHPKTMEPIPGIAETWEISKDGTEYLFHLRKNAKFSDGTPITAKDFVFTFRRALSPELASRSALFGYSLKYGEAYNSAGSFVKNPDGTFLLKKDFEENSTAVETHDSLGTPSDFHKFLDSPERIWLKAEGKDRTEQLEANPKLKAAIQGKDLVPVKAEDVGVEAVDDYTLRLKLYQPTPYFIGLLAHQLFRVIPQHVIEKYGKNWSKAENIVTSGAFKVTVHKPYDKVVVVKDPNYWDAANVHLDGIEFYPLDEATTMMNLYKTNDVYALYNHTPPAAWLDQIKGVYTAEYMDQPEVATEFYVINVKKPPMDNVKVRQAFALAIDRESLAKFRKTTKPLTDFTPEGIFPKYEEARKKIQDVKLKELKISEADWKKRIFDPERARKLLAEAGYPVQGSDGSFNCPSFPVDKVNISYNTAESNKAVAEFVQAQWKQNLGITIPLKNMEFKTFLPMLNKVEYDGFGRRGWVGDYMDPFTFIGLFYTKANDGATGWWKQEFDDLMTKSNNEIDEAKRYELMAQAEFMMMQEQPIIPLMTQATNWIKKPFVKGLYPNPGTLHAWKFVYIERDPNKWDTDVDNILKNSDPLVDEQLKQLEAPQKALEAAQKAAVAEQQK
ncbi:MAG: peptide ABC transporter substrate-binding protein [Pyrinomonadaceae bacterium]|nr:peptide ABC transporter substrate-binding protein [Pyrinomonadaceae bacterium]